jgi:hypothetical protein
MATGRIPTTANSPLTVKGDLFGYSTTQARVPVGNDGETLVADSSTTTGLRYGANFAAGKNKIINGDFSIWQRGTSFTNFGAYYAADRFRVETVGSGTASTISQQSFSYGDISGYNPQYYLRYVKNNTTADALSITQRIEDVRTFAGQTVTLSFWAKGNSAFTNEPLTLQSFGTGGSGDVYTTYTTQSITTSWARYSMTFTMPSVSGKTIGAGSFVSMYFIRYTGSANITVDVWGVQVEQGSTATAFQTATGTIQGELAACCRYFESYKSAQNDAGLLIGTMYLNNSFIGAFPYSEKRVEPSFTLVNSGAFDIVYGATVKDSSGLTLSFSNPNKKWSQFAVSSTGTPFTQGNAGVLRTDLNFEIQISAEL